MTLTFFAPKAITEVGANLDGLMTRAEIQQKIGLSKADHFRKNYLLPALEQAMVAMSLPDKSNSSKQRDYLTELGLKLKRMSGYSAVDDRWCPISGSRAARFSRYRVRN